MESFLSQKQAQDFDAELMGPEFAFSVDQLMELAGLSVASSIRDVFPPDTHRRCLLVCGPGNNGGDGLVAARHLTHFGYDCSIVYPKQSRADLFSRLTTQCKNLDISVSPSCPTTEEVDKKFDVLVDAVFGFSFSGTPRAPFDDILRTLRTTTRDVVSVDVPSGWNVDLGPPEDEKMNEFALKPTMLVSLTAPKLCAKMFDGIHYLGGRFVPQKLAKKYSLSLPVYHTSQQFVRL